MIDVKVPDLPEGYVMLDAVVLVKCINDEGSVRYVEHYPTTMPLMEKYGMVLSAADSMRDQIQAGSRQR